MVHTASPGEETAMIVINCSKETKWVWEAVSAGYDRNADVLRKLVRAYEDDPGSSRSTSPLHPSQETSVGKPPKRIRIPCPLELKQRWVAMTSGYDNYSDQLRALLSAYANQVVKSNAVRVEL